MVRPSPNAGASRPAAHLNVAVHALVRLAAIIALAVSVNSLARLPKFRILIDGTKTRAYSLSPQTRRMLADLEGEWTIALLMREDQADTSIRRQVDEVLRQFETTSPRIRISRVDSVDPRSFPELEHLIQRLRLIYQGATDDYDAALDHGFRELQTGELFVQQQGPRLQAALARLDLQDQRRQTVEERINLVSLLAEQGESIRARINEARRTTTDQPIPDYDAARSILVQTLAQLSGEVQALAASLDQWAVDADIDGVVRQFASASRTDFHRMAQALTAAVDPLKRLPDLELTAIGQRMREGDAAIVLGPTRAAVIPASQLFPGLNLRLDDRGGVTFDQRFRGEQLIAAAIRSLLIDRMPKVVFVHPSPDSMLRQRERKIDLAGAAAVLRAAGYSVSEWNVGESARPVVESGETAVWVIVPPAQRTQLEPDERERRLIEAAIELIQEGQSVLLSLYPSLLPKYRQTDPWQSLGESFGLFADSGHVIAERVLVSEREHRTERGQAIQQFPGDHPIAQAIHGQQVYFPLPVPIQPAVDAPPSVSRTWIAAVEPSASRWRAEDWADESQLDRAPTESERIAEPVPIVAAAERPRPDGAGAQRFIMVGSGGWLLSFVADVTVPLGDDRVALANPGNHELLLASVAWLAGLDDQIAPSALSRQVERLDGVSPGIRTAWFWITMVALPGACMCLGALVWVRRRGSP